MSTQILAAGTTADNSTSVTVVAGAPVTVGLFASAPGVDSEAIPYCKPSLRVQIENPDESFTDTGVELDSSNQSALLIAPGVYRVARSADTSASVGVFSSDGGL
ncbi:MAG: hypothetical protein V4636_20010 [Pseudomonadota bacterium]